MRTANRRDSTHKTIVTAFRKLGWAVADTSRVGGDFPDLVIAKHTPAGRITALVECKAPKENPTPGQIAFASTWPGKTHLCRSVEDVLVAHDFHQNAEAP